MSSTPKQVPLFSNLSATGFSQAGAFSSWLTPACILASDVVAFTLIACVTVTVRSMLAPAGFRFHSYLDLLPFWGMLVPAFLLNGLYPGSLIHPAEEMRRIFYSLSVVFLIWASIVFLWRTGEFNSRSAFLAAWVVGSPIILLTRYSTRRILGNKVWWGVPAVVLGSGPTAQRIVRKLKNGALGVKVTGVFSEEQILSWGNDMPPVLGDLESARRLAGTRVAQYAIIAMPNKSNLDLSNAIHDYCQGFSHVLLIPDMPGVCSLGITARDIGGDLGLELPQRLFHKSAALTKRLLDIVVSVVVLLALTPIFLLIILSIKMTSPGPVFYGQSRFGRRGRVFKAFKFRTMISNADEVLADYLISNPERMTEWQRDHKLKCDPRVTKTGKWLRRYSLDELPQLINVLWGQMSLVGPRPIVAEEITHYGKNYSLYTRVLPGISGLWQVSGRNNTSYDERVAFDGFYVNNWSVWLDLYILIRTLKVVTTADGAY